MPSPSRQRRKSLGRPRIFLPDVDGEELDEVPRGPVACPGDQRPKHATHRPFRNQLEAHSPSFSICSITMRILFCSISTSV